MHVYGNNTYIHVYTRIYTHGQTKQIKCSILPTKEPSRRGWLRIEIMEKHDHQLTQQAKQNIGNNNKKKN